MMNLYDVLTAKTRATKRAQRRKRREAFEAVLPQAKLIYKEGVAPHLRQVAEHGQQRAIVFLDDLHCYSNKPEVKDALAQVWSLYDGRQLLAEALAYLGRRDGLLVPDKEVCNAHVKFEWPEKKT